MKKKYKTPTVWYHGTSAHAWKKIQKDGFLLGVGPNNRRFTFLALERGEAQAYGDIVLRVEYDPRKDFFNNNYFPDCLEVKVTSKIPLTNIKRM